MKLHEALIGSVRVPVFCKRAVGLRQAQAWRLRQTVEAGARAACPLTASKRPKRARCPRATPSTFRAGCELFGLSTTRVIGLLSLLLLLATPPGAQSTQPFQLGALGRLTNGSFAFSLSAPPGRTYVVDASTNLAAWNPLLTNIAPSSTVVVVDTNAAQLRYRFYRGRLYWTVIVPNTYASWQTTTSGSGRQLSFPSGWQTAKGADGRTIAFPTGWNTAQGSDGRLVAFPPGFTNRAGADGRLVAFYPTGFSTAQGNDGRLLVFPASGWMVLWGADGRKIALPATGFSAANGLDGRLVAFPSAGWTTSRGADGRNVAYLPGDFVTVQGIDGRKIAVPSSGWALRPGPDGRMTSYPANTSATINLDFQDQSLFALLGALKTVLSPSDFNNYVVYTFFGTGEQQFAD